MTDGNGTTWYTVHEVARKGDRAPKTIRRLVRPYRAECRLVRQGKHPRKVLAIPEVVVRAILNRLSREKSRLLT